MKQNIKTRFFNKKTLQIVGILLIFLTAIILLWQGNANSQQAIPATPAQVYFAGEYRVGDGEWQKIEEGKHIPATQDEVVLRGNFHVLTPDGEYVGLLDADMPIVFCLNHIGMTIDEGEGGYLVDHENPVFKDAACGIVYLVYYTMSGGEKPIEITIYNPHQFGNDSAIDQFLDSVAIYTGADFAKSVLDAGEPQRNTGILFVVVSCVVLGTVLFSALIRIKNSKVFCFFGLVILFAGLYFIYSSKVIAFWSESIVSNTTILGISMMFYALFLSMVVSCFLTKTKKIGITTSIALGVVNVVCAMLPVFTNVLFYDTWLYWAIIQVFVNMLLIGCVVKEFLSINPKQRNSKEI